MLKNIFVRGKHSSKVAWYKLLCFEFKNIACKYKLNSLAFGACSRQSINKFIKGVFNDCFEVKKLLNITKTASKDADF